MAENCIELCGVNKFFGKKQVLDDINLTVPIGGIYGLLGPSGCGKTTTVKIIAGILEATTGEVYLLGKPMPSLELMAQIGYEAQSDALYDSLSGQENLEFFASLYGLAGKQATARIEELLVLVNLSGEQNKPVVYYSGGMKRRLSLAAALLHRPSVLILDEPTVGIDPVLRKQIWAELYALAAQGTTVLVTTHVMDEAARCHYLAMMRDGRLLAVGTPAQIIAQSGAENLEDAFLIFSSQEAAADES